MSALLEMTDMNFLSSKIGLTITSTRFYILLTYFFFAVFSFATACAAASLAIGTLKGEQET